MYACKGYFLHLFFALSHSILTYSSIPVSLKPNKAVVRCLILYISNYLPYLQYVLAGDTKHLQHL